jgi:hypothetical protein
MAKKAEPSRVAAALQYLQQMRDRAADFGGGVVDTLADRARDVGGLAYEAFTSDPNIGRMTTAEYAQAADRPTPRLDQAAQDLGTIGKAIVTQPIQTGKALVQGEVERARQAMTSPRAAGEYAGSMVDPLRLASALRRGPMLELDVYHGSPHRFEEFDASKIGTGEGAQAYGHGIYLAENPEIAKGYRDRLQRQGKMDSTGQLDSMMEKSLPKVQGGYEIKGVIYPYHKDLIEGISQGLIKKGDIPDDLYNVAKSYTEPGALYTADLPDEMVDRMLDWDKRISDQPEFVQKAWADWRASPQAQKLVKQMTARGSSAQDIEKMFANPTGETMHKWIYEGYGSAKGGEMPKVASFLKDKGLLGVKYQDAGSRGQGGSGTRNFVVFPGEEKKVKILKRE